MSARKIREQIINPDRLTGGLTPEMLVRGVENTYRLLDQIDVPLLEADGLRLTGLVELANLSSIVGNLLAVGIINACDGAFVRAGAHKYQDLRGHPDRKDSENIEIKVALEDNSPKGHLAKAGFYLTCRYILGDQNGRYDKDKRGDVVWIWELRFGELDEDDFSISNTPGDSGKTAVVKTAALKTKMHQVYFDRAFCPKKNVDRYVRDYGTIPAKIVRPR